MRNFWLLLFTVNFDSSWDVIIKFCCLLLSFTLFVYCCILQLFTRIVVYCYIYCCCLFVVYFYWWLLLLIVKVVVYCCCLLLWFTVYCFVLFFTVIVYCCCLLLFVYCYCLLLLLTVTERCGVGGGTHHVTAACPYYPSECDCTQHTRVCRLDWVNTQHITTHVTVCNNKQLSKLAYVSYLVHIRMYHLHDI